MPKKIDPRDVPDSVTLKALYNAHKLSLSQIASRYPECSRTTIRNLMRKYGIKVRSKSAGAKIREERKKVKF